MIANLLPPQQNVLMATMPHAILLLNNLKARFKEPSVFPLGDIHVIHVFIYLFVDWSQLDDLHENEYKSY